LVVLQRVPCTFHQCMSSMTSAPKRQFMQYSVALGCWIWCANHFVISQCLLQFTQDAKIGIINTQTCHVLTCLQLMLNKHHLPHVPATRWQTQTDLAALLHEPAPAAFPILAHHNGYHN
jgi:hypothetical protein